MSSSPSVDALLEMPVQPSSSSPRPRGKKSRGGQPGNLNAVRHGIRTFWLRRVLKDEDGWIAHLVDNYEEQLVAELGGADIVSAGQRRMAEICRAARTCWLLGLAKNDGVTLKDAARFMAIEQKGLAAIGLERRSKPVQSLTQYISERYGNRDPESTSGNGAVAAPLESAPPEPNGEAEL